MKLFTKRFNRQDMKEKLLVGLVTAGIFLPARLLFYNYVSQYWVGSFVLVSAIAVIMFALIRKDKLGKFGRMFERQIYKLVRSRIAKVYIVVTLISIGIYTTAIILIDRFDGYWHVERDMLFAIIVQTDPSHNFDKLMKIYHIPSPSSDVVSKVEKMTPQQKIDFLQSSKTNNEFIASLTLGIMNHIYNGWVAHFIIVGLVSSCETFSLYWLYRKGLRQQPLETGNGELS